jgi:hypothetical protein
MRSVENNQYWKGKRAPNAVDRSGQTFNHWHIVSYSFTDKYRKSQYQALHDLVVQTQNHYKYVPFKNDFKTLPPIYKAF